MKKSALFPENPASYKILESADNAKKKNFLYKTHNRLYNVLIIKLLEPIGIFCTFPAQIIRYTDSFAGKPVIF